MTEKPENLWPTDFGMPQSTPPVVLLKQQASLLGTITNNLVEAEINTTQSGNQFYHTLVLVAPALDNYRYALLRVIHEIDLYPLEMRYLPTGVSNTVTDENSFKAHLSSCFAEPKTRQVIAALIAQSKNQ